MEDFFFSTESRPYMPKKKTTKTMVTTPSFDFKKYLPFVLVALLGGLTALGGGRLMGWGNSGFAFAPSSNTPVHFANYAPGNGAAIADFTFAADKSLPVVVHIAANIRQSGAQNMQGFDFQGLPDPFRQFFGAPRGNQPRDEEEAQATGSGVILSADGYIVTNNHVVKDADALTVTLNDKRTFKAKVIGTDPSTDLALIKIDASDLPFVRMGNSDELKVGEWVVAIGNPFNLAGTVTAGIVSAKGRDIHINQDKAPIESFIQTDAVVNPGNSGGALVNLEGDLVGINTAIASPTGVYAGYAFAVPSNLVQKVVQDLRQYGVVQRGYLGIIIRDQPKPKEDGWVAGVHVDSLAENSAAGAAGVKSGDVITKVDGQPVGSSPELLESIGQHRPGDKVTLTVKRGGSERDFAVVLKNRSGNTDVVKKSEPGEILDALGAEFESLDKKDAHRLGIDGGVVVKSLNGGKLANQTDIHEGFIITKINNQRVTSVDELSNILVQQKGGVMLEGIYPSNPDQLYYYAFGL